MGDDDESTPRPPAVILAGSTAIAPVLPIHQARAREGESVQEQLESGRAASRDDIELQGIHLHRISTDARGRSFDIDYDHEDDHLLQQSTSSISGHTPSSMPKKNSNSRSPNPRGRARQDANETVATTSASLSELPNGITSLGGGSSSTKMNGGAFHERRKHPSTLEIHDEDSADARARLMGRDTFSLDNEPPDTPTHQESSKGFFELPLQDRRNFLLLVLLYFLQGIPMGLAAGSVPFLLKHHLSYSQIGVYSLASYPYSLKLLWSPIVDAWWNAKVGRRKSWILPIQTLSGLGMLWLGASAQQMMEKAGEDNGAGIWGFTGWWFALVFMCATQDIAVDGKIQIFILTMLKTMLTDNGRLGLDTPVPI
jgi:hypothetical protein